MNPVLCSTCGALFSRLVELRRHERTVHASPEDKEEFACVYCRKVFNRRDNLKRHQAACEQKPGPSAGYACDTCGKSFGRKDSLKRHTKKCEPQEAIPAPAPVPVPAAAGARSPKRKRADSATQPQPKRKPQYIIPDPVEPPENLSVEAQEIVRQNWTAIRTHHTVDQPVQDRFNFRLESENLVDLHPLLWEMFHRQTTRFKINLSYGFALRNTVSGEFRYFHSSQNNARVLDRPVLIAERGHFTTFLRRIAEEVDVLQWARNQRPDSKWTVDMVTNATFYLNHLDNYPIGTSVNLPDYVHQNSAIIGLAKNKHGFAYQDHLCLFRCLALHQGYTTHNLEAHARTLFRMYSEELVGDFLGVTLDELQHIENMFDVNVQVYCLEEEGSDHTVAKLRRQSLGRHPSTLYLHLYEDHFSYITNFERFASAFACRKCGKHWKTGWALTRHESTCTTEVKKVYPGGAYTTPPTVFDLLENEGISVRREDRFYPYRAMFDFESWFDRSSLPANSAKQTWEAAHKPLSFSVCSNIPGFDQPICEVTTGDTSALIGKLVHYFEQYSAAAYDLLLIKYAGVLNQLERKLQGGLLAEPGPEESHPLGILKKKFLGYLREIPVVGFNSGKYDINLIKTALIPELHKQTDIKFVVKKNNNIMALATDNWKLLDLVNYLAPGVSYAKYLKAFQCVETKGLFPYEWMDDLTKLENEVLPPIEAFRSSLRNTELSPEDYAYCKETWDTHQMKSFSDFLVWYNNRDVVPGLEALAKQSSFYESRNIDMLKDGLSVPRLTLKYLFQSLDEDVYFTLFGKKNADLHDLIKNNIVGGPSLIFNRYQEAGKTNIRQEEFQDHAKPCASVVGYDANALYLSAIMKPMPTKWCTRRQAENDFKPESSQHWGHAAVEWLEWLMLCNDTYIQHGFNSKEKRVGRRNIPVDGWDPKSNTIFQFHGCFWHGHDCEVNHAKPYNDVRHKPMAELRAETEEITSYLRSLGYNVIELWECEWKQMKRTDRELQRFIGMHHRRRNDKVGQMTQEDIVQGIVEGRIFGMAEVDINVPESLKEHFSELPPIFKNTEVSREDIGAHMASFAAENNLLPKPRRMLISSYFGEKILLATPLLQWYLKHGLVITKVHQVLEYEPDDCFRPFGEAVSQARRDGDSDPDKAIIADTMKLLGNSAYGKTVTNKDRHTDVRFVGRGDASSLINENRFRQLSPLTEDVYEVELNRQKVVYDLPHQIGYFVYQYAKLRMLEFYYDFLLKYVDRKDFELCEMDTDSLYIALSAPSLEQVIKPDLKAEFYLERNQWLPSECCDDHLPAYIETKLADQAWAGLEPCCLERQRFDRRTPGLFKVEWEGTGIVGLCSKTYYCFGDTGDKLSSKGLSKQQNSLTKDQYLNVLQTGTSDGGTNRGFRVHNHQIYTYSQMRKSLSYFYPKRKVLADGITTRPLTL